MAYWLMKTEPHEFSYQDLVARGLEPWSGVKNAVALKHIRAMRPGDQFLFYHTGTERAVVGVGNISSEVRQDPQASDSRLVLVDVTPAYAFRRPVPLSEIKADPRFAQWELVRQSRLSVMPVSEEQWRWLHLLGDTPV